MCKKCEDAPEINLDIEALVEQYQRNLEDLMALHDSVEKLGARDRSFANDLWANFHNRGALTDKQWYWVQQLLSRIKGAEPIYGNFDPILVMFQLAGLHLKKPRVRLMSKEGTYVQLNFYPNREGKKDVDIYIDGWQGHGYRKFAGWVRSDCIVPYRQDRMKDDVKIVIQELALDPIGTAKAMAGLLGACLYCGQRLSDERSKAVGYGPVCAEHWGLPWG